LRIILFAISVVSLSFSCIGQNSYDRYKYQKKNALSVCVSFHEILNDNLKNLAEKGKRKPNVEQLQSDILSDLGRNQISVSEDFMVEDNSRSNKWCHTGECYSKDEISTIRYPFFKTDKTNVTLYKYYMRKVVQIDAYNFDCLGYSKERNEYYVSFRDHPSSAKKRIKYPSYNDRLMVLEYINGHFSIKKIHFLSLSIREAVLNNTQKFLVGEYRSSVSKNIFIDGKSYLLELEKQGYSSILIKEMKADIDGQAVSHYKALVKQADKNSNYLEVKNICYEALEVVNGKQYFNAWLKKANGQIEQGVLKEVNRDLDNCNIAEAKRKIASNNLDIEKSHVTKKHESCLIAQLKEAKRDDKFIEARRITAKLIEIAPENDDYKRELDKLIEFEWQYHIKAAKRQNDVNLKREHLESAYWLKDKNRSVIKSDRDVSLLYKLTIKEAKDQLDDGMNYFKMHDLVKAQDMFEKTNRTLNYYRQRSYFINAPNKNKYGKNITAKFTKPTSKREAKIKRVKNRYGGYCDDERLEKYHHRFQKRRNARRTIYVGASYFYDYINESNSLENYSFNVNYGRLGVFASDINLGNSTGSVGGYFKLWKPINLKIGYAHIDVSEPIPSVYEEYGGMSYSLERYPLLVGVSFVFPFYQIELEHNFSDGVINVGVGLNLKRRNAFESRMVMDDGNSDKYSPYKNHKKQLRDTRYKFRSTRKRGFLRLFSYCY
jgi:hypothetical protein